jgi:hypothetical protein
VVHLGLGRFSIQNQRRFSYHFLMGWRWIPAKDLSRSHVETSMGYWYGIIIIVIIVTIVYYGIIMVILMGYNSNNSNNSNNHTLWFFDIAMDNGPNRNRWCTPFLKMGGFSMAMLNNQMVYNMSMIWYEYIPSSKA